MARYFGRRLIQLIPILFGVSVVTFLLVRLIPGDPAISMLGSRATPALIARIHRQFGLNLPIWQQYLHYMDGVFHANFGISIFYEQSVWPLVVSRIPLTLELLVYSAVIALAIAVPLASIAAARRGGAVDHGIRLSATTALGVPSFWLGILLILLLGVRVRIFPVGGAGTGVADRLYSLTLPALTAVLAITPILLRTLRSSLIEVLRADFVSTARAVGLPRRTVFRSYILRNSILPCLTVLNVNIGWLIGTVIVVEDVFGLPGLGSLLVSSISTRDYSIIQLATLFFAFFVIAANLVMDLLYGVVDPRISLARKAA
jgi:peptide/nickel transport system permease protein